MENNRALQGGAGPSEREIRIDDESDILVARSFARDIGAMAGFDDVDLTLISTAVSELARNILDYARRGEVRLRLLDDGGRRGIAIVASDEGPGIPDIEAAMQDGFSTGGGLGLGLPGTRRLTDEFEISSGPDGTVVEARKWVLPP
ncbi:MAG: anti-sigma regulatory factor [Gaiellaceae bacterium]